LRSCARGSCGIGSPARFADARGRGGWRWPTRGRSPTAGFTWSRCPTGGGWGSSTRRWSTRPVRARCSCPGPRPGGSWRLVALGRHPRPRCSRRRALLEGRLDRPAQGAGEGDRHIRALGR
jgi:hypothetical protein